MIKELLPKYTFIEDLGSTKLTVEIESTHMYEIFSAMMDFAKKIGINDENLKEMFDDYVNGY